MQFIKYFHKAFFVCFSLLVFNNAKAQDIKNAKKVEINPVSSIYIFAPVTQNEAEKLGQYLLNEKYFDTTKDRAIVLAKKGKTYIVRFVVDVPYLKEHPELRKGFQDLAPKISKIVFGKAPVKIELIDGDLKKV